MASAESFTSGAVEIQPDGVISAWSTPSYDATSFTSIAALAYPVNS